jgi:hypothetical protein
MTMANGATYVSQVDYPKGSIQNSMSDDELRAKFESLAAPVLGASRAAAVCERVQNIEACGNVAELMRLTSKPKSAGTKRPRKAAPSAARAVKRRR